MSDTDGGAQRSPLEQKVLGLFALAMINVAAVLSIRNFPSMAVYGWSCIGWYVIGAIFFLIPISLAGAELATGWPEGGGVYAWVKQAFGEKGGFTALFCEWSNNLVWFPTVLSFIASTLAFALTPSLATSGLYMFIGHDDRLLGYNRHCLLWRGDLDKIRQHRGHPRQHHPCHPDHPPRGLVDGIRRRPLSCRHSRSAPWSRSINLSTLPFFATVILLFAGMEMAGFHALETRDPQKDFPRPWQYQQSSS